MAVLRSPLRRSFRTAGTTSWRNAMAVTPRRVFRSMRSGAHAIRQSGNSRLHSSAGHAGRTSRTRRRPRSPSLRLHDHRVTDGRSCQDATVLSRSQTIPALASASFRWITYRCRSLPQRCQLPLKRWRHVRCPLPSGVFRVLHTRLTIYAQRYL